MKHGLNLVAYFVSKVGTLNQVVHIWSYNDMMEFDNDELSATIARNTASFNIVFDESRHVSSALSCPSPKPWAPSSS